MTDIVYSTQRVPNLGGRKIQNPVHFITPEDGVKVVYLQDGFPAIQDAYERKGAKVKSLEDIPGPAASPAPAEKKEK